MKGILILGKTPPPIGGVTIHVSRLIQHLESDGFEYTFYSLLNSVFSVFVAARKYKVIHLHTSNPRFHFLFSLYCFIFRIRLLQTYHGDLNRYKALNAFFNNMSLHLTNVPIVINTNSQDYALRRNRNTRLISAFLPPLYPNPLSSDIVNSIDAWRGNHHPIYCTNASYFQIDKYGNEVYGGSALVEVFRTLGPRGLIFSEPKGEYKAHLEKEGELPENVLFITQEHDFFEVLKLSDCFIRATTTDGDSLSVKEALSLGKPVIASDCVDRPIACNLFKTNDFHDLERQIRGLKLEANSVSHDFNGFEDIKSLYLEYLTDT
jgi:glycosyltransferase involved in cell wall biosynthesis